MKRRALLIILIILFSSLYLAHIPVANRETIDDLLPLDKPWLTVLLLPLDSRPPCTQFVEQLGRIANIRVILPPDEMLDHFRNPSDKQALREWLKQNAASADAAIVSVDMLIHGGLLSSRLSQGPEEDIQETLSLFRDIHQQNPHLKLYAFHVIPRLLIADGSDNAVYRKDLLDYSILKNELSVFENPNDYKKLTEIEKRVPAAVIKNYESLYEQNFAINRELLKLAQDQIFTELVIGQDDGHSFGIPNMIKEKLQNIIQHDPLLAKRVFLTRGADEIAADLLARIAATQSNQSPKVYVAYSSESAPAVIMPYMPHSVATTVHEKIALIHGQEVPSPDEATFILYVHIGSEKTTDAMLTHSAQQIKNYMERGYPVAVVDLSENFYAKQSLLPTLMKEKVKIGELAAYAGWNTTSNSVGTAVAQALVATGSLEASDQVKQHDQAQLEFLLSRFLDDYYYEKEIQPWINRRIENLNANPYDLPDGHMQETNETVQLFLTSKANELFQKAFQDKPIQLTDQYGARTYQISQLSCDSALPWERTFEIKVMPSFTLEIKN